MVPAQGVAPTPPEIATAGRPQATEQFGASVENLPIIDAHIHLFDGTRPQGAGYMGSAAYRALSQTSLPARYASLARPSGIVGAIVVESSGWVEDNLWYLMVSEPDPFIVGVSGRLIRTNRNLANFWSGITRTRYIEPFGRAASTPTPMAKSPWTRLPSTI